MPDKRARAAEPEGKADASSVHHDAYLKGREYLKRSDEADNLDKAIESFKRAVELDPGNAHAYTLLSEAYWRKYESTKQVEWVAEAQKNGLLAVELGDKLAAAAHVNLGTVYAGSGRPEEALNEFRQALALDPVNDNCWRGLAATYQALGRHEEAEAFHKSATGRWGHPWKGFSHRGVFYFNQGRYAEAEAQFLRIPPDQPIRAKLLGGLYLVMGRHEEAIEILKQALKDGPTPGVYNNLANALLLAGRPQEAVAMAEKAIEARPSDYRFRGTLAEIYASLSDSRSTAAYNAAIELALQQLTVHPKNGEVMSDLAVYQAKTKKDKDALASIGTALTLAPDHWDVTRNALIVYETTGNRSQALTTLQAAAGKGQSVKTILRDPALAKLSEEPNSIRLAESQPGSGLTARARG